MTTADSTTLSVGTSSWQAILILAALVMITGKWDTVIRIEIPG